MIVTRKIPYKWKSKDIAEFAEQIAGLLNAGISVIDCLVILSDQYKGKKRGQIKQIIQLIESGNSMVDALKKIHFPMQVVAMIGVAETHGKLADTFSTLGEWFSNRYEFRRRISQKLAYPIFLLIFSSILLYFFIFTLFPRFQQLLSNFNTDLPPSTKFLFRIQNFINDNQLNIIFILLFITLLSFISIYFLNRKMKLLQVYFRIPLLKGILQVRYTYILTSQLGLLLNAGLGIWNALIEIRQQLPSRYLGNLIQEIEKHILEGNPLSSLRLTIPLFHREFYHLTSLGERQGTLSTQLILCSRLMERKMESRIKLMMKWIEPLLLLLLGGMVSFIIISLFTPIIQIMKVI